MAALALGASADGYNLELKWQRTDVANLLVGGVRQGIGVNGKFYINDTEWTSAGGTGEPLFYVYGETGEPTIIDGFGNTAVTADEAGHIIVNTAAFPASINGSTIKVLDPNTLEVLAEYTIPEECGLNGRCDFFGVPKGDLTQDGVIYLTAGNTNTDPFTAGVAVLAVSGGEVDFDNTYLCPVNGGITGITSTVINYYKDLNGNDALLYAYRSGAPTKLLMGENEYTKTAIALPGKGFSNGCFPFVWDGKELFIYSYKGSDATNYLDGWAIAEAGAEEPLIAVPSTFATAANGYQNNWLNAVVENDGVTIYQYYPGGYLKVYRLTKEAEEMVYTVVGPSEIFGSNWDPNDETNNLVVGENGYTWHKEGVTLYNNFEFKVVGNHDYGIYEWPVGPYNWVANLTEGEGIYTIDITFNPNADDENKITCTLTKTGDVTPIEHVYTVAGPAAIFGSEWDATDANNDMVLDSETGLYTWSKENVELNEDFGFKVVGDHSWSNEWPQGYGNNWIAYLPDGAGIYNIVITYNPAEPVEKIGCTLTRVDAPTYIRGDVDDNKVVNIQDVTALINYLLTKNTEGVNLQSADCDVNSVINIQDVTALINFLLTKNWPAAE